MKFILALLILFFVPFSPLRAAAAEERYAVAAGPDVWFCAGQSESSRLFLIPYTYYVKVCGEGEFYTAVEYLTDDAPFRKVSGYCKTEDLLFVDFIPERPYLKREITLSYTLSQSQGTDTGAFGSIERDFVYYGHRYEGAELYYYVLSDGVFGYVPAEKELEYDLNTDYLSYLETAGTEAEGTDMGGLSAAEIVVICAACVAAVAIAVFVLKGKKPPVPEEDRSDL